MFYWLYYTTANVSSYTERPLAIWLQGGPGGSSAGFGNFRELGPLDVQGIERNWTWVKDMNVLAPPVYGRLKTELMKPVIYIVNELLEKTPLKVSAATGNLDLICAAPGTVNWIAKLEWRGKGEYLRASRTAINVEGILEGYQKTGENFTLFWIDRSGHNIPADNPAAMSHVLRQITSFG